MNTLFTEAIKGFGEGALVAFSALSVCVVLILLYKNLTLLFIRIGGRFMTSKEVLINSARRRGYDLKPFKKDYDSKDLVLILEALMVGVNPNLFKEKVLTSEEIIRLKEGQTVEEDKESVLPSIKEVDRFGFDKSLIINLSDLNYPYEITGVNQAIIRFPGQGNVAFSVLEVEEGYLLHKYGYTSFFAEK